MDFEKRFYSKENFLVLQGILNKVTNEDYSSLDNKNILFETMRNSFKTTPQTERNLDTRFHNLNKSVIGSLMKNKPTLSNTQFPKSKETMLTPDDSKTIGKGLNSVSMGENINTIQITPTGITNEKSNTKELFNDVSKQTKIF